QGENLPRGVTDLLFEADLVVPNFIEGRRLKQADYPANQVVHSASFYTICTGQYRILGTAAGIYTRWMIRLLKQTVGDCVVSNDRDDHAGGSCTAGAEPGGDIGQVPLSGRICGQELARTCRQQRQDIEIS